MAALLDVTSQFVEVRGMLIPKPTEHDKRKAERLTRLQEQLFDRLCHLPDTEQGQGEAASIKRRVASLEMQKHTLCQIANQHLLS